MTKLKSIKGEANKERNEAIVAFLEKALEDARAGRYEDVLLLGNVRGAWMTDVLWDSDNELMLIGALEAAKVEILSAYLDETDPDDDGGGEEITGT